MARILIVDDEDNNRDLLNDLLSHEGHEILLAKDGQEALTLYEASPPNLIITDIMMPNKNGYEVIEEIRAQTQDVKIIALAAAGDLALARARASGADAALEKPFHIHHLLTVVGELLSR